MFDGGCVLLAERGREPLKGQWSLPGGALETGETLKEGVRREVLEETGLEVEPLWIAEVFERIMRDAGGRAEYHYVLVDYVCRIAGGEPRAGDDVSAVRWVPVAALGEYEMTEGTRGVIERAYQKTLQHEPDKR
ncbi:MAG TPA: NUDIX hydrolase [Solibacterales bacterium]|nr:NUDIX hydrolase [Bryobacterales bacterium]